MLLYIGYVVVQFFLWFKFYFPLIFDMVMYGSEIETKENKIYTKEKIEQHNIATFPHLHFCPNCSYYLHLKDPLSAIYHKALFTGCNLLH